jgi:hypothetical protein
MNMRPALRFSLIGLFASLACFLLTGPLAIAGADDEAYYKQFHYVAENQSADPDYPDMIYYFLAADMYHPIAHSPTQDIMMMNDVKITDDGKFVMAYSDGLRDQGSQSWAPRYCFSVDGTWSVPDKTLLFKDANGKVIMEGTRYFLNQKNAMMITYKAGFPVSELVEKQNPYGIVQANYEPTFRCMFPGGPTPK